MRRKLIKIIFFLIVISCTSCNKRPVADFSFKSDTYAGGDSLYLVNLSQNGKSAIWEFPDGTFHEEYSPRYFIPTNTEEKNLTFIMKVLSKRKRSETISKSIKIYPHSEFDCTVNPFPHPSLPTSITCSKENSNWCITAQLWDDDGHGGSWFYCYIFLPGDSSTIIPGSYNLTMINTTTSYAGTQIANGVVANGNAAVVFSWYTREGGWYDKWISNSGQLFVSLRPNGKARVVFNNIDSDFYSNDVPSTGTSNKLFGDISCK